MSKLYKPPTPIMAQPISATPLADDLLNNMSSIMPDDGLAALFGPQPPQQPQPPAFESEVPVSGVPIAQAEKLGLKGSQVFGQPPKSVGPEAATAVAAGQRPKAIAPGGGGQPQSSGNPVQESLLAAGQSMPFHTVGEAEAYLTHTYLPFVQLTAEQKHYRNLAHEIVREDHETRYRMLRAILNADDISSLEIHVEATSQTGALFRDGSAGQTVLAAPSPAGPELEDDDDLDDGGTVPLAAPTGHAYGPPTSPIAAKAQAQTGAVTPGPIDNSRTAEIAENMRLIRQPCANKAVHCNAPRSQHAGTDGKCFKPNCTCKGRCQAYVESGAVAQPPLASAIAASPIQKGSEVKAGPIVAPASTFRTEQPVSEDPPNRPASNQSGPGQGHAQPDSGSANVEQGTLIEQGVERAANEAVRQDNIGAQMMARLELIEAPLVGEDADTVWWNIEPDMSDASVERRATILSRMRAFLIKGFFLNPETQAVRPDIQPTASYRVVLAGRKLVTAIEAFAIGRPVNKDQNEALVKVVHEAAIEYLNAHHPIPADADTPDVDYRTYKQLCGIWGYAEGAPFAEIWALNTEALKEEKAEKSGVVEDVTPF